MNERTIEIDGEEITVIFDYESPSRGLMDLTGFQIDPDIPAYYEIVGAVYEKDGKSAMFDYTEDQIIEKLEESVE